MQTQTQTQTISNLINEPTIIQIKMSDGYFSLFRYAADQLKLKLKFHWKRLMNGNSTNVCAALCVREIYQPDTCVIIWQDAFINRAAVEYFNLLEQNYWINWNELGTSENQLKKIATCSIRCSIISSHWTHFGSISESMCSSFVHSDRKNSLLLLS